MSRAPEHKGLVDAIIDQEIEAQELADKATKKGDALCKRLSAVARALVRLRMSRKITVQQAMAKWEQEFRDQVLADYAEIAPEAAALVDRHLPGQVKEIEKLGKPLREVAAIRDTDIKARAVEKADTKGKITDAAEPGNSN